MDEFYVHLVSNASMYIYPYNTLRKFTNKLASPLELDGDWDVGLTEIFYPTEHEIEQRQLYISLIDSTGIHPGIYFEYKEIDDISKLIDETNMLLRLKKEHLTQRIGEGDRKMSLLKLFDNRV